MVNQQFEKSLMSKNYEVRKRYTAYRVDDAVPQPHEDIFSAFKGFTYRILSLENSIFLPLDPHVFLKTNCSIHDLATKGIPVEGLKDLPVRYFAADKTGIDGYLFVLPKEQTEGIRAKLRHTEKLNRHLLTSP